MCNTVEQLHPFQSTRDLDGTYCDRETVQDIAFDGETFGRIKPKKMRRKAKDVALPKA
jgi:hypothetical protein